MSRKPEASTDSDALAALSPAAVEALAASLPERAPGPERQEVMRARILDSVRGLQPPTGSDTLFGDEGIWLKFDDYIDFKILHADPRRRIQTALWRLKPGANFPPHGHRSDEECLVLSGEISIGDHRLKAGDFHYMYAGHRHPPITSRDGALLMIRAEELNEPGPALSALLRMRNFFLHRRDSRPS